MVSLKDCFNLKSILLLGLFFGILGLFDYVNGSFTRAQQVTVLHIGGLNAQHEFRVVVLTPSGDPKFITYGVTLRDHIYENDKLIVEGTDRQFARSDTRNMIGLLLSLLFLCSAYCYWKYLIRCQCANLTFVRNVYGDEINHINARSVWRCQQPDCNRIHYKPTLYQPLDISQVV